MWTLLEQCLKVITRRAELDQQFAELLNPWAFLAGTSRYADLLQAAENIEIDDALQRRLLEDTYNYHAFLFWPLFPELSAETVFDIALSGRIYSDYQIALDRLIDGDEMETMPAITQLKVDFLHEHSMNLLYRHFSPDSPFWCEFRRHKQELLWAVLQEKQLQAGVSFPAGNNPLFTQIAHGKSAMAKCTLAALATAANDWEQLERFYHLFDEVALVAQFCDDFKDWQSDLEQGQPSALLSAFQRELGERIVWEELVTNLKKFKRRFYFSQALHDALITCQQRLTTIMATPEFADCADWLQVLHVYQTWCNHMHHQIKLARQRAVSLHPTNQQPLEKALQFLMASQRVDGAWSDFWTTAGESTDWVTGYVSTVLPVTPQTKTPLAQATHWLRGQQFPAGGWGYHRRVVVDADSTAACLRFLADRLHKTELKRSITALLRFQNPDGGFSTYIDSNDIAPVMSLDPSHDFSGWCQSQTGVTAMAVLALCATEAQRGDLAPAVQQAVRFLLRQQRPDGAWNAYWWHGDIYATSLSSLALYEAISQKLVPLSRRLLTAQEEAIGYLLETQQASGGWGAYPTDDACPFQTGLALQALATSNIAPTAVRSGVLFLHNNQEINGCWRARTGIMRLPTPDDRHPWQSPRDLPTGTTLGSLVPDQNRVFTTATVVAALKRTECTREPQPETPQLTEVVA